MSEAYVLTAFVSFVLSLACAVSLGRIWLYSKELVDLLREIRDHFLLQPPRGLQPPPLPVTHPTQPAPSAPVIRVGGMRRPGGV
jgi:hypothetical protein